MSENERLNRAGPFALFLICGLVFFLLSMTFAARIPTAFALTGRISLTAVFLVSALLARRGERFARYREVSYVFFVASFSLLLSWLLGGRILQLLGVTVDTPVGIAVAKLCESALIVAPIIVLIGVSRNDMSLLYLWKGNLRLGLSVGLGTFVIFSGISILQTAGQEIGIERYLAMTPWVLLFVLTNGFMEELLFRGLFLRSYAAFVGPRLANLLTAIIFAAAHVQVTYTPDVPLFVALTFVLSLFWGWLIQRTDSLWGSALSHAGADTLIIVAIFVAYGAA